MSNEYVRFARESLRQFLTCREEVGQVRVGKKENRGHLFLRHRGSVPFRRLQWARKGVSKQLHVFALCTTERFFSVERVPAWEPRNTFNPVSSPRYVSRSFSLANPRRASMGK